MAELSPEKQAVLDSLVDDTMVDNPRYAWDENFQRRILGMLLTDKFFLIQSQSLVKSSYFTNQVHQMVCRLLFAYFQKYKQLPERYMMVEELKVAIAAKDSSIKLEYISELNSVYEFFVPGFASRDALLDKLTSFAKVQALKEAFFQSTQCMKNDPDSDHTWNKIHNLLRDALAVDRTFDVGLEFFPKIEEVFDRMKAEEEVGERFTSGFEAIDNAIAGGGAKRGEIYSWIGLPGTGKSLALVKAAVQNVLKGHKVLYITLEMDEVGIAERFMSQFALKPINYLFQNKNDIVAHVHDWMKAYENPNRLIVRQFPGGSVDVNTIRAYHSQLQLYGFKPDLVIIDYIGEMRDDPNLQTWESRYRMLRDLRGFGVEEGHCTFTCVQPNKTAAELEITEYIDEGNIGASFDQYKPLDGFWSINQLTEEKACNIGRGFVIKHRRGKSRFPFCIGFNYDILDMFQISDHKWKVAHHNYVGKAASDVPVDKIKPKFDPATATEDDI
jgi:replicative DNA helicase